MYFNKNLSINDNKLLTNIYYCVIMLVYWRYNSMKKEETKQKLIKISEKGCKVIKVFKILCIVLLVILALALFANCLKLIFMDSVIEYLNDNLHLWGDKTFNFSKTIGIGRVQITVKEALEQNLYDDIILSETISNISPVAFLIVILVFLKSVKGLFISIANVDSPFSKEVLDSIKKTFISLSILVIMIDVLCGIIAGLCLSCFYVLYKYGCEIQEENDQTV